MSTVLGVTTVIRKASRRRVDGAPGALQNLAGSRYNSEPYRELARPPPSARPGARGPASAPRGRCHGHLSCLRSGDRNRRVRRRERRHGELSGLRGDPRGYQHLSGRAGRRRRGRGRGRVRRKERRVVGHRRGRRRLGRVMTTPQAAVAPLAADLEAKERRLVDTLAGLESVIVAFSGGVDSAYLACMAARVLGPRALAVTADSPSYPEHHRRMALRVVRAFALVHEFVRTSELERPDY